MKPVPLPEQIAHCTVDKQSEWKYQLPKFGFGVLGLLGLVVGFLFRDTEYGILIGAIVFIGAIGALIWFVNRKRNIACNRCGRPMDILDIDWSAEQFSDLGGRICGSFFTGADGRIYKEGRYRDQQRQSHYTIDVMKQRWYACDACQSCFLGERLLAVQVFKAGSGMKQAISNLKNDPELGRQMEARHQGRE